MTLALVFDNLSTMPFSKLSLPRICLVTSVIFAATQLSGCSAIGVTKNAALQVTSNPQASVFLNDKHLGKTPYFSDQLKEGTYTLKISVSEASYVDKIELKNGALTVVNRDLNNNYFAQTGEVLWLKDGKKDVFIGSIPTSAEITVDGQAKGKSPQLIEDLEYGEHKVLITKSGFENREFTVKSSSQYSLMANVTLAAKIAKNPPASENTNNTQKVEILQTPQGFLRVRKEPELSSQEIGQVEVGKTYEIIQETQDWIKISFEGKLGWVSTLYTKKV